MIQGILVALIFAIAVIYIARSIYKAFESKSACASGCGKCGAVDFEKINKQLTEKGL